MASPICPESVRAEIAQFLAAEKVDASSLVEPSVYEPWEAADLDAFRDHNRKADTWRAVPRRRSSGVTVEYPVD
jgi:hypothetical protein